FFFQAEDGIRARNVTGVQTCALPIWPRPCDREKSEGRIRTARHQREREHPSRPPVLKGAKHGAILRLVTHSFRRGSNHRRAGTGLTVTKRRFVTIPSGTRHRVGNFLKFLLHARTPSNLLELATLPLELNTRHPSSLTRLTRTTRPGLNPKGPLSKLRIPPSTRNVSPAIMIRSSGNTENSDGA